MADDFRSMMRSAMGKATGNVSLRLWTPQGADRRVRPPGGTRRIEDLTDRARPGRAR